MDIVAKIRAAKDLSEALGCLVRHFAADTGTLHLLMSIPGYSISQRAHKPQGIEIAGDLLASCMPR